ncbi:hypothetical protein SCOR_27340 [Sulfidibacter corallicola]|uniref:Uncharacterized protein n=1 Tax=Sulfidibacter corallicola TaxID=2818388 RepID=A0A8A4TME5_SULCO|nr:hypothetical protein [Sulfidibacter corallicola]QTD50730.1 hypothetical protein J3U87_34525 [Sulfidibacter corallicola]
MIVIIVLAVLSALVITALGNYQATQLNSRRVADLDHLITVVNSHYEINDTIPDPDGNTRKFDHNGNYTHSYTDALGISGYVGSSTFPKTFLAMPIFDPYTKHLYAYGKQYGEKPHFDFGTIINRQGEYISYITGNFSGELLTSLIKDFNSPHFVDDGSPDFLPYDPYDRRVTGRF